MGFGILEPVFGEPAPAGTVLLEDDHDHVITDIRVPQPSGSSADPLNMSKLRKELYFFTLLFGACIMGAIGPLLIPGFSIVAEEFEITLTEVTLLNGALVMTLGISAYLCAFLADICGRRLIFLTTTTISIIGCVWASYATSYPSLLASRTVQGLGMGGFMSLAGTASINDVFFVHERGRRIGLWNFAVLLAVNLTPVISGYVITGLSWPWSFRLMAVGLGVAWILTVLFLPETIFERYTSSDRVRITRSQEKTMDGTSENDESKAHDAVSLPKELGTQERSITRVSVGDVKRTNFIGLHLIEIKSFSHLPKMIVSPFLALRHPAVVWAAVMWSVFFTWVIIQGAVADQIYRAPPYNLDPQQVGVLIGIPPLIGSALGTVLGGWVSDILVKVLARRNNGIYEPEFRLLLICPGALSAAVGAYGLGIAISKGSTLWASVVLLAVLNFGVGVGCTGIVAYCNDGISHIATETHGVAMVRPGPISSAVATLRSPRVLNSGANNSVRYQVDQKLFRIWLDFHAK